ncbi:hypothetical protein MMC10_010607 [Thelotrema lepadinum]|nr:hypothetical protein [Thelotrema lepadinum]
MPRTRAAQRTTVLEDLEDAVRVPLPSTPQRSDRAPLGEIFLNEQEAPKIQLEVNLEKPAKKPTEKKSKGAGRKKKATKENSRPGSGPEVIEDDCESSASSAVEEACQELRSRKKDENFRAPCLDRRPQTPPSKAVRAARRKLSPKSETPRFNPEIHKTPESAVKNTVEDSFVAVIESRSPAKIANARPILGKVQEEAVAEESILEDPVTPQGVTDVTPGKSPRIEDSVEAIDALEEAIEQAGQSLAAVRDDGPSPTKARKPALKSSTKATSTSSQAKLGPKANTSKPLTGGKPAAQKTPNAKSATLKATATRPAVGNPSSRPSIAKQPAAKKAHQSPPKPNPTPSKAATTRAKIAPKPAKKRVSSISNPPFVPTKSTKAPTSSTFTLPGEAVSARLKAQREERLKQEEQDLNTKRKFKARPAPSGRLSNASSATLPRQTASSKARESLAKGELPTIKPTIKPRVSSTGAVVDLKTNNSTTKSVSAAAAKRPSLSAVFPTRPINPSPNKAATATAPTTVKTGSVRGKPNFKAQKEQQDKILKEKMEAAKKARVDAAERGRAASKEWAERRKREAEARKASGKGDTSPKATGTAEGAVSKVVAA